MCQPVFPKTGLIIELDPQRSPSQDTTDGLDVSNWSYNPGRIILWLVLAMVLVYGATWPSKETELVKAASRNDADTIIALVRKGVSVNAATRNQHRTALMAAASKGNRDSIEMFLKLGANKSAKDTNGKTALDYAIENGNTNLFGLLKFSE